MMEITKTAKIIFSKTVAQDGRTFVWMSAQEVVFTILTLR